MSDLWLIDETAIEARLARLVGGRLALVRHYPKLGAAARVPRPGDLFAARAGVLRRAAGGRFFDLGAAGEGFIRGASDVPEGAMVLAAVVQAPQAEKVARLVLGAGNPGEDAAAKLAAEAAAAQTPARLRAAPGPVRTLIGFAKPGDRVQIASAGLLREAKALAAANAPQLEAAAADVFETEGAEAMIEAALGVVVALLGGGRLVVEMTHALTAIDVDTADARDAPAANVAAAQAIAFEIAARELAGTILVDFPHIRERGEAEALARRIMEQANAIGLSLDVAPGRRGLVDIRRARGEAPLAARLTQSGVTHTAIAPVLSFPAQAARLARELARTRPAARRSARLAPAFSAWLDGAGIEYKEALQTAAAGTLAFAADPALAPDGLDLP